MIKWEKTKWGSWKWGWDWWIEFKNRRSRPVRILGNLLLAAVLLFLLYVLNGSPDANLNQAFRREEERNLIGPGNILGSVSVENIDFGYDSLLLAETDEGVILYTYSEDSFSVMGNKRTSTNQGNMIYREKGENVTLMAAPGHMVRDVRTGVSLPVILFDSCPEAVRAELDLYIDTSPSFGGKEVTWHVTAQRERSGFFLFELVSSAEDEEQLASEVYSIHCLCRMFDGFGSYADGLPATVRLYDKADNLILEKDFTVHSNGSAAHTKQETQ